VVAFARPSALNDFLSDTLGGLRVSAVGRLEDNNGAFKGLGYPANVFEAEYLF